MRGGVVLQGALHELESSRRGAGVVVGTGVGCGKVGSPPPLLKYDRGRGGLEPTPSFCRIEGGGGLNLPPPTTHQPTEGALTQLATTITLGSVL